MDNHLSELNCEFEETEPNVYIENNAIFRFFERHLQSLLYELEDENVCMRFRVASDDSQEKVFRVRIRAHKWLQRPTGEWSRDNSIKTIAGKGHGLDYTIETTFEDIAYSLAQQTCHALNENDQYHSVFIEIVMKGDSNALHTLQGLNKHFTSGLNVGGRGADSYAMARTETQSNPNVDIARTLGPALVDITRDHVLRMQNSIDSKDSRIFDLMERVHSLDMDNSELTLRLELGENAILQVERTRRLELALSSLEPGINSFMEAFMPNMRDIMGDFVAYKTAPTGDKPVNGAPPDLTVDMLKHILYTIIVDTKQNDKILPVLDSIHKGLVANPAAFTVVHLAKLAQIAEVLGVKIETP